jgi:ethanolamine utilization protein EutP
MKKVLMVGNVSCGKTTLLQAMAGEELAYKKTQSIEVVAGHIDSPGEYLERRVNLQNLLVTSVDTDLVLFLLDPTQERYMYSGGQAAAFPVPVAGVITKADIASREQIEQARELLELTGADPIFVVSSYTGEGIAELLDFLS